MYNATFEHNLKEAHVLNANKDGIYLFTLTLNKILLTLYLL